MRVSNPVRNLKPTCPFARNWPTVAPTPASCRTRPQIGEMNEPARARPDVQRQRMQGPGRMGPVVEQPETAYLATAENLASVHRPPRAPGELPRRPQLPPRDRPGH